MIISINKQKKERLFNPIELCLIAVIFLCGMNLFAKFFYFCYIAFFLCLISSKRVNFSYSFILVGAFSIVFGIYGASSGLIEMFRRLAFFCMYFVGYNLVARSDNGVDSRAEKKMITYFTAFALGALVHYLINFALNFNLTVRNGIDVWSMSRMAATGQAALAVPALGIAIALMIDPKNEFMRIVGIVLLLAIMGYDLILAVRFLLLIFIIVLVISILTYLFIEKNIKRKRRMVLICAAVMIVLALAYIFNWFGIRYIVSMSNFYTRIEEYNQGGSALQTDRLAQKSYHLKHFFDHMLGGGNMSKEVGYAHDLLLDAYDDCGIFTFILLVFILALYCVSAGRVFFSRKATVRTKIFVLCLSCCFLGLFFVEPILYGELWMFAGFLMMAGMLEGYANRLTKRIFYM